MSVKVRSAAATPRDYSNKEHRAYGDKVLDALGSQMCVAATAAQARGWAAQFAAAAAVFDDAVLRLETSLLCMVAVEIEIDVGGKYAIRSFVQQP